jgi:hypothetical protein
MSQLNVTAVVSPFRISLGTTPLGEANIVVSVTDTNGGPVTGLVQTNFQVMMIYELNPVPAHINTFINDKVTFPPDSLPGVYELGVNTRDGFWSRVPYTFVVVVTQKRNQGQTVVLMDLSDLLPSDTEAH